MELADKYVRLTDYIKNLGSVAVAFSAGADSTFLLKAAKDALGDRVIAITANPAFFPDRDLEESISFCEKQGIPHYIISVDENTIEGFAENPPDRCYFCKYALFSSIIQLAHEHGISAVIEGSNADDDKDYRPGHRAITELKVISPMRDCGLSKAEIRAISRKLDLPTWNKPSFACLASRIPYGETITREKLKMIEEAEQYLFDCGFKQFRVRIHGMDARIELLPEDFDIFMKESMRLKTHKKFKELGFQYISLDLQGFRSGSMNETIST